MEFCINKHTKQYFIYIDRERVGRLHLITPEGRISDLREDLFDDAFEGDEQLLVSQGKVSLGQVKCFEAYIEAYNRLSKIEEARLALGTMINQLLYIEPGEIQPHIENLKTQFRLIQELEEGDN